MTPRLGPHQPIPQDDKRTIKGWVRYDWANSVYQLTISSAIFPIYYNQVTRHGDDFTVHFFGLPVINTVLYSWAIAAAYLLVAFLSPFLSSIADYTGLRKGFMKGFTILGAASCSALFFFDSNTIELGVICFALGTVGYGGSLVFYNSFLPIIASPAEQDKVSARGYISGYLGGVVLLIVNLIVVMQPAFFGITDPKLPAKLAFLSVGLWWFGFSQTTFRRLPKYTFGHRETGTSVILGGYRQLRIVFRQIRRMPRLRIFLPAYFFITMGLLTVMFMAATYGEKALRLGETVLIATILLIQLIGMLGAWLFARLSGRVGNIKAFRLTVYIWIGICVAAYFITDAVGFLCVGIAVGLVMGGSQSLARSTYSKMLPPTEDHTSFFSFFDVMEKLATVAGTFSFGIIEALTGNMRNSVLAITLFFAVGLAFLFRLMVVERRPAAAES
ncbi:MAG: MFS transporter [Acidobacteriota bacterium]|nr:MFS transporter [Acidobacteriota bacterium]HNQ81296.1 MFS transporter [Candidatus Aminicenantes bacterium]MDD8029471.1 MFS transporter [Acidobacteriota bacterium]MDD8033120.1 MFS transporter [Acidobacteriota bacterium]MDD8039600.1 MFS transporter [Acidobacteriota bacterium]